MKRLDVKIRQANDETQIRRIAGHQLVVPVAHLVHTATCVIAQSPNLAKVTSGMEHVAKHLVGKFKNPDFGPTRSTLMLAHLLLTSLSK